MTFFIITILFFGAMWVWIAILFDSIIKYHHDHYNDDWISKGRQRGLFYAPYDSRKIYTGYSLGTYAASLKTIPHWAENDKIAQEMIRRYLFWTKLGIISVIMLIPLTIVVEVLVK